MAKRRKVAPMTLTDHQCDRLERLDNGGYVKWILLQADPVDVI